MDTLRMGFFSDMKVLYHMLVKPVRGDSHAERMESFYGGQAKAYDDFRKRLLKGREELYAEIPRPEHGVWVDRVVHGYVGKQPAGSGWW